MQYLRWFLYSLLGAALVAVTISLIIKACGITIQIGPRKVYASDGIIWLLPPVENSHSADGNGFVYKGDSVSASEKDGFLQVSGSYYGKVQIGDSVDISTRDIVLVNGQLRETP